MKRKRILTALVAVALLLVFLPSLYIGYLELRYTHPPKRPLTNTPDFFDMAYDNVVFKSRGDETTLRGWLIQAPNQNRRIAIFAHGYAENRESAQVALHMAKSLREAGIASLLFDFRASGESDGKATTLGYYEKDDLRGAIDYAESRDYREIGLVGFSMGASTALEVAPDFPEVKAVVADSPFADLTHYLESNLTRLQNLPSSNLLPKVAVWEASLITGINPSDVQPVAAMRRLQNQAVFLIHSEGDDVIPATESEELDQVSASSRTMLWLSSSSGHVGTFNEDPNEYLRRTTRFLQQYLVPDDGENVQMVQNDAPLEAVSALAYNEMKQSE